MKIEVEVPSGSIRWKVEDIGQYCRQNTSFFLQKFKMKLNILLIIGEAVKFV
jgi:hypothetical protein